MARFFVAPVLITGIAASQPFAFAETLTVEDQPFGEIQIVTNGLNPTPNWGLDKIGEQQSDGAAYTYPDTTHPVRLYLIDTAVANPGNWIDANPKLTLEEPTLVRSGTDPSVSSHFGHGTRMLSLIAGINTGVAPGTPIKVKNYDVYPTGTTTATKLASAVRDAVAHYQDSNPRIPSVICIASSASLSGTSASLKSLIEFAVSQGITVVVSAGNLGLDLDAASYIPAAYGTIPGVICVGASDASDTRISISNSGSPVDILAPGFNILAKTEVSGTSYELMTGTSPAAALVAGSALAELSMNGSLTPAQVEARLKDSAKDGSPRILRSTSIAVATIALPDGLITDPSSPTPLASSSFPSIENFSARSSLAETPSLLNVFHGVDDDCKVRYSVSILPRSEMEFTFPIDFSLLDPSDLFTLRNGYAWRIRCSGNLDTWEIPEGSLSKRTASDGTVWLTAKIPAAAPSCFLRVEVVPTAAP